MSIDPNQLASKHTKVDWYISASKRGKNNLNIVSLKLGIRYKVARIPFVYEVEEALPDAHFISATPEAIEFIADLLDTMSRPGIINNTYWINKGEEILKKAYNL